MAAITNTKRMMTYVRRTTIHTWTLAGALAAAAISIMGMLDPEADMTARIAIAGFGVFVLLVLVLAGIIIGAVRADRMKKRIAAQEPSVSTAFDAEDLQPITAEKNLLLGKEWLVINTDKAAVPLAKPLIASADSLNRRKEGMKKLWINITGTDGKTYSCMYRAAENDALAAVQAWLNGPANPAEPADVRAYIPKEGDCPFCTGPNEPGASVCQWCGKPLGSAAAAQAVIPEARK